MDNVLGSCVWFLMAGMFITTIIIGIKTIKRDQKENNPFAAIGFAFQLPALGCCTIFAILSIMAGIGILSH